MRKNKEKDKAVNKMHDGDLLDELERLANEKTALLKVLEKLQTELDDKVIPDSSTEIIN